MAGLSTFRPPTGGINPGPYRRPAPPVAGGNPTTAYTGRTGPGGGANLGGQTPPPPGYAQQQQVQQRQLQTQAQAAALDALKRQMGAPTPAQLYQQQAYDQQQARGDRLYREQVARGDVNSAQINAQIERQRQEQVQAQQQADQFTREAALQRELQAGGFSGQGQLSAQEARQAADMTRLRAELGREQMNFTTGLLQSQAGGDAAADAAAYGRAKDQIAGQQQGALRSLRNLMAQRGISGSGPEAALTGGLVQAGQGALGEVSREQAIQAQERRQQMLDRLASLYSQGLVF